jgi:hypothetical protein
MVTLPPDFVHGRVINIPRILMKHGEATPGIPLNNVAVKITPGLFQIGFSNIGTDRQRNIELIKELSWIDLQILYSDGNWAILGLEKAPLADRALAMLEAPAVEPLPRVPTNPTFNEGRANFSAEFKPRPVAAPEDHTFRGCFQRCRRGRRGCGRRWCRGPCCRIVDLAAGCQPVVRETIRLASTTLAASTPGVKLPSWGLDASRSVIPESVSACGRLISAFQWGAVALRARWSLYRSL